MGKRNKKSKRAAMQDDNEGFGSLAAQLSAAGLQMSEAARQAPDPEPSEDPSEPTPLAEVVLQRERKGRGGKTVVVVRGVPADRREEVARDLRKALGVGSRVEDEDVVVQGEVVDRVRDWFLEQDVRVRGG